MTISRQPTCDVIITTCRIAAFLSHDLLVLDVNGNSEDGPRPVLNRHEGIRLDRVGEDPVGQQVIGGLKMDTANSIWSR